jgi:SNF2 family DNA or RNA helicase
MNGTASREVIDLTGDDDDCAPLIGREAGSASPTQASATPGSSSRKPRGDNDQPNEIVGFLSTTPQQGRMAVQLMPHQQEALKWMTWRESQRSPRGGILADDQGLGKTVSTIALIVSNCGDRERGWKKGGTLVVCPSIVLGQWLKEIETKTTGVSAYPFYQEKRDVSMEELGCYDIVVTTFGTMSRGGGGASMMLREMLWTRIVIDECHIIRNPKTLDAAAAFKLQGERRW